MTKPRIAELSNKESIISSTETKVDVIKSICPINMSIIIPKTNDNEAAFIARVTWLCKSVFDVLFCITTNYVAENEYDEEFLISCPFLEDNACYNYRIASDMMMGTLPHYLTDLDFSFKPESDNLSLHNVSDSEIYILGIEYDKEDMDKTTYHKITLSPEIFATLGFFDSYILDGITNFHDLKRSIMNGPIEDNNTSIYEVDTINVLDMAKVGKRKSTTVAIKMEVNHISKMEEKYTLLVPFDIGKRFPKKKFGKSTTETLSAGFLVNDPTQYINEYTFPIELNGTEYLILRCVNCNKDGKIFAIKNDMRSTLIKMIEEY